MGKLLDELKYHRDSENTQDEILQTYFSSQDITKEDIKQQKKGWFKKTFLILTISGGLLFTALLVIVFGTHKVDIDINIIRRSSYINADEQLLYGNYTFFGNTSMSSRWDGSHLYLVNNGGRKKANLRIEFPSPMDLADGNIVFFAKADLPDTTLHIIISDKNGNSCVSEKFKIETRWQKFVIPTFELRELIDTSRVKQIVFNTYSESPTQNNIEFKDLKYLRP